MSRCPKCETMNEVKLTRCRNCKAIIPVKLESALETCAARVTPSKVSAVDIPCPRCGELNPYSRFKCVHCGVSLTQYRDQNFRERIFAYLGTGALLIILVRLLLRAL